MSPLSYFFDICINVCTIPFCSLEKCFTTKFPDYAYSFSPILAPRQNFQFNDFTSLTVLSVLCTSQISQFPKMLNCLGSFSSSCDPLLCSSCVVSAQSESLCVMVLIKDPLVLALIFETDQQEACNSTVYFKNFVVNRFLNLKSNVMPHTPHVTHRFYMLRRYGSLLSSLICFQVLPCTQQGPKVSDLTYKNRAKWKML